MRGEDRIKEVHNNLRDTIRIMLRTEEGLNFFRFLYHLTGASRTSLVIDRDGKINTELTIALCAKKEIYEEIRKFIDSEKLMQIEKHFWEIQGEKEGNK